MKLPKLIKSYNLYHLLGIESFSGIEDIKSGYRRKALQYHPDRSPQPGKTIRHFVLCAEAYKILQDPQKRQAYDRLLGDVQQDAPAPEFKNGAFLQQKRRSGKNYHSRCAVVDLEYDRFVDEGRENFLQFMKTVPRVKS